MKLKTDKLLVSAYVRHGDMCCVGEHHDMMRCASGHRADDCVLVARFAYLQEAIDYCHKGAKNGCRMVLISRISKDRLYWHYVPEGMAPINGVNLSTVRVVKRG